MTISESLARWIKSLPVNISIDEDSLGAAADKYGLFRMPQRQVSEYGDGSEDITEYYQLLCRQASQTNSDRKENGQWMEDLCYLVDDAVYNDNLPTLTGNRKCHDIEITSTPYVMSADTSTNTYQVQIKITYSRERSNT